MGYPPLKMGWSYLAMVVLAGLLCGFIYFVLFAYLSRYVGSYVLGKISMVVFSLNHFCRRSNSCMEDSFKLY